MRQSPAEYQLDKPANTVVRLKSLYGCRQLSPGSRSKPPGNAAFTAGAIAARSFVPRVQLKAACTYCCVSVCRGVLHRPSPRSESLPLCAIQCQRLLQIADRPADHPGTISSHIRTSASSSMQSCLGRWPAPIKQPAVCSHTAPHATAMARCAACLARTVPKQ